MKARTILGTLATLILTGAVVLSGAVIWAATAGPEWIVKGEAGRGIPRLVLAVLTRALSLVL